MQSSLCTSIVSWSFTRKYTRRSQQQRLRNVHIILKYWDLLNVYIGARQDIGIITFSTLYWHNFIKKLFLAATAALEVQMLVCLCVCASHMLQLHWTSAGLLKDFWGLLRTSDGLLKDFWRTSKGLLKDFWRISEELLKDFWRTSEGLLKDFWRTSEGLLKNF